MTLLAIVDGERRLAEPNLSGLCPYCGYEVLPKCGEIVTWHWAHRADSSCNPKPETPWHLAWKADLFDAGCSVEVRIENHIADVVTPDGHVIELQASPISLDDAQERERFYGTRMVWLFRASWQDSLHYGQKGFWWKHGSKIQARLRRPTWWDFSEALLYEAKLSAVEQYNGTERIVGYYRQAVPAGAAEFLRAIRGRTVGER